jgi:hypothetical protein
MTLCADAIRKSARRQGRRERAPATALFATARRKRRQRVINYFLIQPYAASVFVFRCDKFGKAARQFPPLILSILPFIVNFTHTACDASFTPKKHTRTPLFAKKPSALGIISTDLLILTDSCIK